MRKKHAALVTYLIAFTQVVPAICNAGCRWGRTDTAVAEPGAYFLAGILVPLFLLVMWAFFLAASKEAPRSRPVPLVPVKQHQGRLLSAPSTST
jgi:hypothetical protein